MDQITDRALQAVIGFRIDTIELRGSVRLTLADSDPPSRLAPGDGTPRTLYRISIESAFHVLDAETDIVVCFQPWNDVRATGLNELSDLFRATIDEATGVGHQSLTLKLTTQHSHKRVLRVDDSSGYEAWNLS